MFSDKVVLNTDAPTRIPNTGESHIDLRLWVYGIFRVLNRKVSSLIIVLSLCLVLTDLLFFWFLSSRSGN